MALSSEASQREKFDQAVAILQSINPEGGLGGTDANVLLNAIIGVLSDTYTSPKVGKSDEQLEVDYAPAWVESRKYAPDSVVQSIMTEIEQGNGPLQIKNMVRNKLSLIIKTAKSGGVGKDGKPVTANSLEADYMTEVDRLYNQYQSWQQKKRERDQSQIENDIFLKNGMSSAEARYDPRELFPDKFASLDRDYAQMVKSNSAEAALTSALASRGKSPSAGTRTETASKRITDPYGLGKSERQRGLFDALARQLEASGRTPLKDEMAQRALYIAAADKPKEPKKGKARNYKAVGSNVVPVGA